MTWTYRVFGSLSGELTTGWQEVEAENADAAAVWPTTDIVTSVGPQQDYHVIMRDPTGDREVRFDADGNGKPRGGLRWIELGMAAQ